MKKLLTLVALFTLVACRYDSEEELFPSACDTSNVTYSSTITGIINSYGCLNCHGNNNPIAGFSLTTYAGVKAKITDGRLYGALNHASGFSPMPQGGAKLNPCDLSKVKAWIDAGAPNN